MNTAPWPADVASLPSSGFRHSHSVALVADASGGSFPLSPLTSRVTFDGSRSPRVDGTFVVGWPSAAVRGLLDPRNALTLLVRAGYLVGSRVNVYDLVRLSVTTVALDYVAQTVTITAQSDECVPIGYPAETAYAWTTSQGPAGAIRTLVGDAFPGETLTWDTSDVEATLAFDAAQRLEVGEDRWATITDFAELLGAKCWHDGNRTWYIGRQRSTPGRASQARLRTGATGNITSLLVTDSMARWANRVAAVYEYKSATSAATITTEGAIASTGQGRPRMAVVSRKRKPDNAGRVARHALRRALRRGHTVRTSGTAFLWVRPQDVVTVDMPGGAQERVLVETVTFQLDKGTMEVSGQSPTVSPATVPITTTAFN